MTAAAAAPALRPRPQPDQQHPGWLQRLAASGSGAAVEWAAVPLPASSSAAPAASSSSSEAAMAAPPAPGSPAGKPVPPSRAAAPARPLPGGGWQLPQAASRLPVGGVLLKSGSTFCLQCQRRACNPCRQGSKIITVHCSSTGVCRGVGMERTGEEGVRVKCGQTSGSWYRQAAEGSGSDICLSKSEHHESRPSGRCKQQRCSGGDGRERRRVAAAAAAAPGTWHAERSQKMLWFHPAAQSRPPCSAMPPGRPAI